MKINDAATMKSDKSLRGLGRIICYTLLSALCLTFSAGAKAALKLDESAAARFLPERVENARLVGAPRLTDSMLEGRNPADYQIEGATTHSYLNADGASYDVTVIVAATDAGAYSLFTALAPSRESEIGARDKFIAENRLLFYKSAYVVEIIAPGKTDAAQMKTFAQSVAKLLPNSEDDIPPLVKHLPNWEQAQGSARYAVTPARLKEITHNAPVFSTLNYWQGGTTDAVVAEYDGGAQLVVIEFQTPQLATDADAAIQTRLNAMQAAGGQGLPNSYKRVGNYAVFVLNAPDAATAQKLTDSVQYEQTIQWLGQNPFAYKRQMQYWVSTTTNIFLNVIKVSGVAALVCLGLGAVFGTLVFRKRRNEQTVSEKFSDAGGMVRLNIDELTAEENSARLLGGK